MWLAAYKLRIKQCLTKFSQPGQGLDPWLRSIVEEEGEAVLPLAGRSAC